jgi:hypothetical protein
MAFGRKNKATSYTEYLGYVVVLNTPYGEWRWILEEAKVQRWIKDSDYNLSETADKITLISGTNNLEGATKLAAGREYRRLQAEQRERERRDSSESS